MTLKGKQRNNISMAVTRLQSEALLLRCAWQEVVCTESCEEQGYSHESNAEANLLYGLSPPPAQEAWGAWLRILCGVWCEHTRKCSTELPYAPIIRPVLHVPAGQMLECLCTWWVLRGLCQ
jgi:hypothetical protein